MLTPSFALFKQKSASGCPYGLNVSILENHKNSKWIGGFFKFNFYLFDGGGFTQKAAAAPSKCPYGYKVIKSFVFFQRIKLILN